MGFRIVRLASRHLPRFTAFIAVGVLNTVVGYTIYLSGLGLGLPPAAALASATVIGALFNYVSIGRFVFQERRIALLPRFLAVYAGLYIANLCLLNAIIGAKVPPWLAQGLSLPIVVLAGYILMNIVVFRGRRPNQ